jgi:hypothetical protein
MHLPRRSRGCTTLTRTCCIVGAQAAPKAIEAPKLPTAAFVALDVQPEAERPIRDIGIEPKRGSVTAMVH